MLTDVAVDKQDLSRVLGHRYWSARILPRRGEILETAIPPPTEVFETNVHGNCQLRAKQAALE